MPFHHITVPSWQEVGEGNTRRITLVTPDNRQYTLTLYPSDHQIWAQDAVMVHRDNNNSRLHINNVFDGCHYQTRQYKDAQVLAALSTCGGEMV